MSLNDSKTKKKKNHFSFIGRWRCHFSVNIHLSHQSIDRLYLPELKYIMFTWWMVVCVQLKQPLQYFKTQIDCRISDENLFLIFIECASKSPGTLTFFVAFLFLICCIYSMYKQITHNTYLVRRGAMCVGVNTFSPFAFFLFCPFFFFFVRITFTLLCAMDSILCLLGV